MGDNSIFMKKLHKENPNINKKLATLLFMNAKEEQLKLISELTSKKITLLIKKEYIEDLIFKPKSCVTRMIIGNDNQTQSLNQKKILNIFGSESYDYELIDFKKWVNELQKISIEVENCKKEEEIATKTYEELFCEPKNEEYPEWLKSF